MSETTSSTVTSAPAATGATPASTTPPAPKTPMERRRVAPNPFTGHSPTTKVPGGSTWTPPQKLPVP
jgi:hypothetical protein